MRTLVLAAAWVLIATTTSHADERFDDCIRKLCTSVNQRGCWVKGGAAICDEDQIQCQTLPDHAPADAVEKKGRRWSVITAYGKGWVSDRMMMINGGMCN